MTISKIPVAACAAFQTIWPSALGKILKAKNPTAGKFPFIVCHGTALTPDVKRQILSGRFDQRLLDIYFGPESTAAHFAHMRSADTKYPGVVLLLGSNMLPQKNRAFHQFYFPGNSEQEVYILEAHELNPEYVKVGKIPMKELVLKAIRAAMIVFRDEKTSPNTVKPEESAPSGSMEMPK